MTCSPYMDDGTLGEVLVVTSGSYPTGGDLYVGRVVYNITTGRLEVYNGSTWAAIPTTTTQKVLQVVNTQTGAVATGTTVIPFDDTIPQNTEGDQYMTLAITPVSASSTLLIDVVVHLANSAAPWLVVALFQDSTAGALAAGWRYEATAGGSDAIVFRHKMTSGTTSATTFKVRAGGSSAGTSSFNGNAGARYLGGVVASSITITEIAP